MGYKKRSKTYKLKFSGEYEGLEVTAKSLPLGKFMKMGKLVDMDPNTATGDDFEKLDDLFDLFCLALVDWNLEEEDGSPVEPSKESLYDQDLAFVLMLIVVYMDAVSGVPQDLGKESSSGERSLAASLPMEPL